MNNKSLNMIIMLIVMNITLAFANDWTALNKPTIINDGTGYSNYDIAYSIDIDGSGVYYITGYFDGKIGFGADTLESFGGRDIFVAKVHSSGYFYWARRAGGSNAEIARDIAVDNSGNVYITGYYYGTAQFGNSSLTANRNSDIFVAKLNNSGTWQWARSAGGVGFDRGNAIAVESNGTVYVSGSFENSSTFGTVSLNSSGAKDIFISKLSSAGAWIWSVRAGGTSTEEPNAIKYNANLKKIFLAGYFGGSATFGGTTLSSSGQRDAFLSKLDINGNFNSSVKIGGVAYDEIKNLKLDNANNVYFAGYFEATSAFGSSEFTSAGYRDIFVCVANENLAIQRAYQFGGANDDEAIGIALDSNSNIYFAGTFYDSLLVGDATLISGGDKDTFVAKINQSDEIEWVLQASSPSTLEAYNLVCDRSGNTAIAGAFNKDAEFGEINLSSAGESDIFMASANSAGEWTYAVGKGGVFGIINTKAIIADKFGNKYIAGGFYGTISFGSDTLRSNGDEDIFFVKMNKANNFVWAKSAGGNSSDRAEGIAIDSAGNLYIAGYFSSNAEFGATELTSFGFNDIFVAKLDSNGNFQSAISAGSEMLDKVNSIAVANNGNIYLTGIASENAIFGSISLEGVSEEDIYVAKLNNNLEWQWVVRAGGTGWDSGNSITVDGNENLFVTGYFDESASFGTINLNGFGYDDIFVARVSNAGNWIWAKASGSAQLGEQGSGIIYSNNAIYITGYYKNIATFGSVSLVSKGFSDAFLARMDYNGNWTWAKSIGSTADDEGRALSIYNGNIYLGGTFSASFNLGDSVFTNQGGKDILLLCYNNSGNLLWKQTAGMNYDDEIAGLCIDFESNVSLAGAFYHSTKFGNLQFLNYGSKNKSGYIAKFGLLPPNNSWAYKNNTGRSSEIFISANINPKFGHRNVQSSDAIGVFYTRNSNLYCAGWAYWNGADLTIAVSGDDLNTLTKDGMADNEAYIVKLWDAVRGIDTIVTVRFTNNNKYYSTNNFSIISRLPDYDDTLKIPLRAGWNMISSLVYPYRNASIDSVFKPIKNNIRIVKNISGKVYVPANNLNTIGNWNHKEGYMVYAAVADTLRIVGMQINIDTVQINLAKGWNLLPGLVVEQKNLPNTVQSLVQSGYLKIVKNIFGKVYLPENNLNTIGNMLPNEAYQIYMTEPQVFSFP